MTHQTAFMFSPLTICMCNVMQMPLSGQPLQAKYRGTSVHLHRRRSLVMKQAQRHKMLCEQVYYTSTLGRACGLGCGMWGGGGRC